MAMCLKVWILHKTQSDERHHPVSCLRLSFLIRSIHRQEKQGKRQRHGQYRAITERTVPRTR